MKRPDRKEALAICKLMIAELGVEWKPDVAPKRSNLKDDWYLPVVKRDGGRQGQDTNPQRHSPGVSSATYRHRKQVQELSSMNQMTDPTEAIRKALEAAREAKDTFELHCAMADFHAAATAPSIRALLDRLDSAERDAKRYRWLRDTMKATPDTAEFWPAVRLEMAREQDIAWCEFAASSTDLDAAIDAALRAGEQKEPK
jgi:hypothetical protein